MTNYHISRVYFLFLVICLGLSSLGAENRIALVIGNSGYESGALTNPVNDASDLSEMLKDSGFEVILTTDRNLLQMEEDLRLFKQKIRSGDIALLFYAGHGVQVDGVNYLLPVDNGGIQDESDLKRRAMDISDYVNGMAELGTKLNIVVLDACRDNPLPRSSRGGSRGLSVISTPRNSETVIVFATKAGDVAFDGQGRNSSFTMALLKEMNTPDQGIIDMFNNVGASVRNSTEGKQIPTIYSEPLSEPFYFFSSDAIASRAEEASAEVQAELDTLEREIARLQQEIDNADDKAQKRRLETEQQRQRAIEAAKKIEADNLAREAERKRMLAEQSLNREKALAKAAAENVERQEELNRLAALRRSDLDQLAKNAASKDPDRMIASIEELADILAEIDGQFEDAWEAVKVSIQQSYSKQLKGFNQAKPEIWESDKEFAARIEKEKTGVQDEIETNLTDARREMDIDKDEQTMEIEAAYTTAVDSLHSTIWEYKTGDLLLEFEEYNRDAKQWPFTIGSRIPEIPLPELMLALDFQTASREDLIAFDEAVKADALNLELSTRIIRKEKGKYDLKLNGLRIRNLLDSEIVWSYPVNGELLLAEFPEGRRDRPEPCLGVLVLDWEDNRLVNIDGRGIANAEELLLPAGNYFIDYNIDSHGWDGQSVNVSPGSTTSKRLNPWWKRDVFRSVTAMIGLELDLTEDTPDENNSGMVSLELFTQSVSGMSIRYLPESIFMLNLDNIFSPYFGLRFEFGGGESNGRMEFAMGPQFGIGIHLSPLFKLAYLNMTPLWNTTVNDYSLRFAAGATFMELIGIEFFIDPFNNSAKSGLTVTTNMLYAYALKMLQVPVDRTAANPLSLGGGVNSETLEIDGILDRVGNGLVLGGAASLLVSVAANIAGGFAYSEYQNVTEPGKTSSAWGLASFLSGTSLFSGIAGLTALVVGGGILYFSPDTAKIQQATRIRNNE